MSAAANIARSLVPGSPVMVRVPTDPPKRVPGNITFITAAPDPVKQAYVVKVTIPNPAPDTVIAGLEGAIEISHD